MFVSLESICAAAVLGFWLLLAGISLMALKRLPRLHPASPLSAPPAVSAIVPARNEAAALRQSVPSLTDQSYPDLEVIVVNDRSTDGTDRVLASLESRLPRLRVIDVEALPGGWLGKTHALFVGSRVARGEWLLFTDADVVFHPRCLEAAIAHAEANRADHLVLTPRALTVGFWEAILVSCFGLLFGFGLQAWRVSNPRSSAYIGIGAFNLIRRSAYRTIGTHEALANAVVDDVELGRLVKANGLRQAVARGEDWLSVRWQVGLSGVISGLGKNAFAGVGYSVTRAAGLCLFLATVGIAPFLGLLLGQSWILWGSSALLIIAIQGVHAREARLPVWSAFFHPLAIAVLVYVLIRSAFLALARGSIEWRGTRYPLDGLRQPPGKVKG
jgi:hypothetical protein